MGQLTQLVVHHHPLGFPLRGGLEPQDRFRHQGRRLAVHLPGRTRPPGAADSRPRIFRAARLRRVQERPEVRVGMLRARDMIRQSCPRRGREVVQLLVGHVRHRATKFTRRVFRNCHETLLTL